MINSFNKYKFIVSSLFGLLIVVMSPAYAFDDNANAKDVADKLNELYSRTKPCDNNEPAYYCSGIVIHGQEVPVKDDNDNLISSWYLPTSRNVESYSYLRADITPRSGEPIYINTGFILTPVDELEAHKQFQYKVYCVYPVDGGTFGNADTSCKFSDSNYAGVVVDSKDIRSVNDYITKLLDNPTEPEWQATMGPAFLADKNGFDLAMQIHQYVFKDHLNKVSKHQCLSKTRCKVHNELIISTWEESKVAPEQVPVMAFFAIINDDQNPMFERTGRTSTSDAEMKQLFKDADDYAKAAHYSRSIPVVTIDMAKLRSGARDIFEPAVRP
ncbi:MAG TPA: hypothetical protein VL360_09275 [Gammaproteobacteria bacterium]|jgi:hypothetical protein|nr:hypothetical protein [Gammaproteobacteria bacterium]